MSTHAIEKTLILPAPPARVWDYLTQPEHLAKWFHGPDAPLADGRDFSMPGQDGDPMCWGTVQEMEPPRTLRYSFTARPMNGLMTEVTWTLTPIEAGTRLHLLHTGIPTGADAFDLLIAFDGGWDGHLLQLRKSDL